MRQINFANAKGRDAVVGAVSARRSTRLRWVDERGRQASSARVLRGTLDRDYESLLAKLGDPAAVAKALIESDPELDVEYFGVFLRETSRVYVDVERHLVHSVREMEVARAPDGTEKSRKMAESIAPNTNTEVPLRWSGRLVKRAETIRKVIFASKQQIVHVNGLTYDFLYAIAKELEEKDSFLIVGAGPKSNQPLVFHRGGTQFRGYLEGRTNGDQYMLILHLTNLELRTPGKGEGA